MSNRVTIEVSPSTLRALLNHQAEQGYELADWRKRDIRGNLCSCPMERDCASKAVGARTLRRWCAGS